MASQKVKGLSIQLSADTTAVNQALADVNKASASTQKELTQLNKLLKFDPSNINLLTQKQTLLSDAIKQTTLKLEQLKKVKDLADNDADVDKSTKEYRDLERQIEATKQKLSSLQKESNDVGSALQNAGKDTSTFSDTLKALVSNDLILGGLDLLKNAISSIWNGAKQLASGLVNLIKQGVEYNATIETYTTSIRAMLNDDDVATQKLIKDMKELGSASGFTNDVLLSGARNLLSADINGETATKTIEGLAKAIAYVGGSNDDLSRMITNLQGIASTGKATAQDLKQFKNIGINASKLVADSLGITTEQAEKQGITFDMLSEAFIKASEEGGKFADVFDTLSGTFESQTNKLNANWQQLLGNIALDTTSAISQTILPSINGLLESMNSAFEEDGLSGMIDTFSNGIGDVISTISDEGTIEQVLSGASAIIDAIGSAFDSDTEQGQRNLEELETSVDKLLNGIVGFLTKDEIVEKFINAGFDIASAFAKGFSEYINAWWKDFWGVEGDWTYYDKYKKHMERVNNSGGFSYALNSGGFGALMSGGYSNQNSITLNASFNVNGQFSRQQAMQLADMMTERINENIGTRYV